MHPYTCIRASRYSHITRQTYLNTNAYLHSSGRHGYQPTRCSHHVGQMAPTNLRKFALRKDLAPYIHSYIYTYIHSYIYTFIYIYIHIYMDVCGDRRRMDRFMHNVPMNTYVHAQLQNEADKAVAAATNHLQSFTKSAVCTHSCVQTKAGMRS